MSKSKLNIILLADFSKLEIRLQAMQSANAMSKAFDVLSKTINAKSTTIKLINKLFQDVRSEKDL